MAIENRGDAGQQAANFANSVQEKTWDEFVNRDRSHLQAEVTQVAYAHELGWRMTEDDPDSVSHPLFLKTSDVSVIGKALSDVLHHYAVESNNQRASHIRRKEATDKRLWTSDLNLAFRVFLGADERSCPDASDKQMIETSMRPPAYRALVAELLPPYKPQSTPEQEGMYQSLQAVCQEYWRRSNTSDPQTSQRLERILQGGNEE